MKKTISLLLAAMMLVGIFVGCGVESGCSLRRRKQHP